MKVSKMLRSFGYAGKGFMTLLKSENNFQFHFLAAVLVISAGFVLCITHLEWLAVLIMIGLVFMAEAFNTAIEKLCDHVTPERHSEIGKIKDIAAAGVLVVSVVAVLVALLIFVKYLTL